MSNLVKLTTLNQHKKYEDSFKVLYIVSLIRFKSKLNIGVELQKIMLRILFKIAEFLILRLSLIFENIVNIQTFVSCMFLIS